MLSLHFINIRRASTTIDSVSEGCFLIIERIDFSPEFAVFRSFRAVASAFIESSFLKQSLNFSLNLAREEFIYSRL